MSDNDCLSSEQEMAAWDKWKEICFIDGCPDAERTYLRRRVIYSMRELLLKKRAISNLAQFDDALVNDDDIVTAFDLFMAYKDGAPVDIGITRRSAPDTPPDAAKGRSAYTRHKEHIWKKMLASSDPHLKVLNGKLLGPMGIIQDVSDWLIEKYFPAYKKRKVQEETGKYIRRFEYCTSMDSPLTEDSDSTLGDLLVDDSIVTPDQAAAGSAHEFGEVAQRLLGILDNSEKAILLALLCEMNCSAPELCAALGRQKSAACEMAGKLKQRLHDWLADNDAETLWDMDFYKILVAALVADLRQQKPQTKDMKDFLATITQLHGERFGVEN
ncbi:MAG: hypothetical protein GX945_00210 [Lentisphaerae bacterium]|nr:hypothetical protein [Lentisphaerota bacterium]